MDCCDNRLVIELKSGEARAFNITIQGKTGGFIDGEPQYKGFDLNNYTLELDIKDYPNFKVKPIIHKDITTKNIDGSYISDANKGKVVINFSLEDLEKLPDIKDYYLILTLVSGTQRIIISGEGDNSGVLRYCKS